MTWIADRGYEWEEFRVREVVEKESGGCLVAFTEEQAVNNPMIILESYAKFAKK